MMTNSNSAQDISYQVIATAYSELQKAQEAYNLALGGLRAHDDICDDKIPDDLQTPSVREFVTDKLSRYVSANIAPLRVFNLEDVIFSSFSGFAVLPDEHKDHIFYTNLCDAINVAKDSAKDAHALLTQKRVVQFVDVQYQILNREIFDALHRKEKQYVIDNADATCTNQQARNLIVLLDFIGSIAFTEDEIKQFIDDAFLGNCIQNPLFTMKKQASGVKVTLSDMAYSSFQGNLNTVHFAQKNLRAVLSTLEESVRSIGAKRAEGCISIYDLRMKRREERLLKRRKAQVSQ